MTDCQQYSQHGFHGLTVPSLWRRGQFSPPNCPSCCKCLQRRLYKINGRPIKAKMVIILGRWYADVSYVPLQAVHLPKSHCANSGKCHHMEKKNDQKWRWGPTELKKKLLQVAKRQSDPHVPCHEHCYSRPAARGDTLLVKQPSCARGESEKVPTGCAKSKSMTTFFFREYDVFAVVGPLKRWPTNSAVLKTPVNLHLAVLLYGLHMLKLYLKKLSPVFTYGK